jgi:DNA modification methylase
MKVTKHQLFGDIDFKKIAEDANFKEDSVREEIILPILKQLGYDQENIVRSKMLIHPFLKIGSNKKREIKLIPDYLLKIGENYACVLDAKSSKQKIVNNENVEQVYSYAIHPEVRSNYFALCSGLEFSLFRTANPQEPILFFEIAEIENHWEKLALFLSPDSFHTGKNITYIIEKWSDSFLKNGDDWYKKRKPLNEIPVKKQAAKRHFGVHAYFTSQAWNVVQEYIKNFSRQGDVVLDPFGGRGVTAIEAMMTDRKAISVDLNPMAVFITQSLLAPVNLDEFQEAYEKIKNEYIKLEPKTEKEINEALKKYKLPKDLPLPKSSDVKSVLKLFTKQQLAQLALLKSLINKQKNKNIKSSLLLMFSGLVSKANLTVHSNEDIEKNKKAQGGFNCAPFMYYRYRIAHHPKKLDILNYFESRFKRIYAAKKDIRPFINEHTIENARIIKGTATDLSFLPKQSVDYIYTDPPYGKKIPYLDLSAMWNAWLDLEVTEEDYQQEAIEGGEQKKSKDEYNELIAQSIKEMYRVLKFDRWLSFVFAHKDPEFWHLIIDTAESCGFEYAGAVAQKNGQTSFKKRQNPFTVLSGQLIINFRKVRNPKAILKANLGMGIAEIVMQTIEGIIAKNNGATLEQINDELIIKGLELGFLDLLKKEYTDLTPILMSSFDYDDETELFTIQKNSKFMTHIDVRLRIRYYLLSYLRRMERENKVSTFNEIIFDILPLLKNGTTPENQTILGVLEHIAERVGQDSWRLKRDGQQILFD